MKRRNLLEKKIEQETERAKEFTRTKNKRGAARTRCLSPVPALPICCQIGLLWCSLVMGDCWAITAAYELSCFSGSWLVHGTGLCNRVSIAGRRQDHVIRLYRRLYRATVAAELLVACSPDQLQRVQSMSQCPPVIFSLPAS